MAIVADSNNKSSTVSSPRRNNSSISSTWKPNDPPPAGYGIIYVIQHYHMGKFVGRYVGLTRRACAKRWAEHILEAQRNLSIRPRQPKRGANKREMGATYQYESATSKPLHTAMTIAIGRQINEDFSNNFSFHIVGLYSLFTLDSVEAALISEVGVGVSVAAPRTYDRVRYVNSYNLRNEPSDIPGNSFMGRGYANNDKKNEPTSISFVLQVLALEAYVNYEWEPADSVPDYLKISARTPQDIYEAIFTYFTDNKKFTPSSLKNATELRKAIIRILDFKIVAGQKGYLMFNNMPYLSLKALNIGISSYFGSASGSGKKGKVSAAMGRLGSSLQNVDRSLLVPKNKEDQIFKDDKKVPEIFFKAVDDYAKKNTGRIPKMKKAVEDLENLHNQIVEMLVKSMEAKDVKQMDAIQQEMNKLIEKYQKKFTQYEYNQIIQAFIVKDNKD
jgi:hypothetical protein